VIRYADAGRCTDPATALARSGDRFAWTPDRGRLDAVLARLQVPSWSQVLVFGKTSLQRDHIGPATPRAIYFDESNYVAWVPGAPEIEVLTVDPRQGARFHAVDQDPAADGAMAPRTTCLRCHDGPKTRRVPGLLVQSVRTAADGTVVSEHIDFVNGHAAPLPTRWGGWYVTGKGGTPTHRGNVPAPEDSVREPAGNLRDSLEGIVDLSRYRERTSDLVALLVLQHQVGVVNHVVRAGWDVRVDAMLLARGDIDTTERSRRIENSAREVAAQILFDDEALLPVPLVEPGAFARRYQAVARKDRRGRSLRELDLHRRLYRRALSPMVHAPAFRALPPPLLDAIGRHVRRRLAALPAVEAEGVRAILSDTEPELAARWFTRKRPSSKGMQRRTPV